MKNNQLSFNLYRGKVISIDDVDKQGKVQVQLLPEMVNIEPDNCPWFPPFNGNSSKNEMHSNLPEVGSLIWIIADDIFYSRYYLDFKYDIKGLFDYSKVEDILGSISGLDTTYKNIQFTLYEDGSLDFHNRLDSSHGFISKNGASIIVKEDSSLEVVNSKASLIILADGTITILGAKDIDINSDAKVTITGGGDINITSDTNISVDATANTTIKASGILTLETGDAVTWQPNIIPACLFTSAPHGGVAGGIVKLKGG